MADTSIAARAGRSVNYPFIQLSEAIKRARVFWKQEGKNLVPMGVAVKHWGYGEKSSGGKQTVAALKQFALMRDTGEGPNRKVCLSPLGLEVLMPTDDQAHLAAIRKAAVAPKIYAELLSMWQPDAMPSDQAIAAYLVREKDFNPNVVSDFIKDFKANIAFASLTSSATIPPATQPSIATDSAGEKIAAADVVVSGTGFPGGGTYGSVPQQDTFTLSEGQVILRWPSKMSQESFEDFKAWIELQVRKIGRSTG